MKTPVFQAITTKFIPATNYRGSRIKAECDRGSITISYPYELSGADCHIAAADALCAKFVAEDVKKYGSDASNNTWAKPRICGGTKTGYCHVFVA